MELIELRVMATVLSLLVFLGILAWAYAAPQRRRFEHDAHIPFIEDEPLQPDSARPAAGSNPARRTPLLVVARGPAGKE